MSTAGNDLYAPPSSDLDSLVPSTGGVTEGALQQLRGTRGWVRLVSIVTLLVAALALLGTLGILAATLFGELGGALMIGAGAGYLLIAVVYAMLGYYLFRFASAITRSLETRSADDVCNAMGLQRRFWRMAGVLGIVSCVIGGAFMFAMPAYMSFMERAFETESSATGG